MGQKRTASRIVGLLLPLMVLGLVLVGFWQRQAIFDWWRLRDYEAPVAISQLATDTTMTPRAERFFYVYHPQLDDKVAFNENCPHIEQTIVLGCYVTHQGIYIYDVQEPRLQGIKQVTAAHEMLHVAYERLSSGERQRVDQLLQEAYAQVSNERTRSTIESYQHHGADISNELHSILGTEIAHLPPALEEYYRQYFADRSRVVAYAEAYEQEFTSRQQQVAALDAQLAHLQSRIDAAYADINALDAALQAERQRLDGYRRAESYALYNAGVVGFNAMVRDYNGLIAATRAQVEEYNRLVHQRNQLAVEQRDLAEAIDSRLEAQEAQ